MINTESILTALKGIKIFDMDKDFRLKGELLAD